MSYLEPGSVEMTASGAKSATFNSTKEVKTTHAKTVELWIDVTATSSGDFTFNLQTGFDDAVQAADTTADADWVTVKSKANVSTVGTHCLLITRETECMGENIRLNCVRNAGTLTFSTRLIVRE